MKKILVIAFLSTLLVACGDSSGKKKTGKATPKAEEQVLVEQNKAKNEEANTDDYYAFDEVNSTNSTRSTPPENAINGETELRVYSAPPDLVVGDQIVTQEQGNKKTISVKSDKEFMIYEYEAL